MDSTNTTAGKEDGISLWVKEQLLDGYDVHVWDDGHDWLQSDDCDEWGKGPALDMLANAINHHGQSDVAIVGYSHGAGSVFNISKRMYFDGQSCNWYGNIKTFEQVILQPYSLVFTSYIDAVRNSSWLSGSPEDQRPWGSKYHLNQYQTNGLVYWGCPTLEDAFGDGVTINIDRTNDLPTLYHMTIPYDDAVQFLLTTDFQEKVER